MDVVSHTYSRGISLLELVITIAFLSIMLSIAVPSWQSFTQKHTISTTRAHFTALFNSARIAAVSQQQSITLCPSLDADSCSEDHTSWQQGYIVFVDQNGDKSRDYNEQLLRAQKPFRNSIKIHSSSGRKAIRYAMDGSAWGSNVTLRFCAPNNTNNNLAIILHGAGRLRLSNKLSNGGAITC